MNVGAPILDAVPGTRGRVLHVLCHATGSVSGREVARRAHVSVSTAISILADLAQAGIVTKDLFAHANGYQLNRQHLVARAVIQLAGVQATLTSEIREHIVGWPVQPVAAWLYGSTARGDGDRASDIDVLFVLPDMTEGERERWEEDQIAALQVAVWDMTGNRLSYLPHTIDTFLALEAQESAFSKNLHAEGIDLLADSSSWRRIGQARRSASA